MDGLTFDLTTLKAGDYPTLKGASAGQLVAVLPHVVTACPAEWGAPNDLKTWRKLPMATLAQVLRAMGEAQRALPDAKLTGWTFDLESISVDDYDAIMNAMRAIEPKRAAKLLAKWAAGSPTGTHKDHLRYLEMPYYTQFKPLCEMLVKEAESELQSFLAALVSAPEV